MGHLHVRGTAVMDGYLDAPEINAKSFAPGGWFRTGDLAVVEDGQMAIAGRQKEVLIVNGNNVYPHEIETVVEGVAGVLPSFAVASPTRVGGAQTDEVIVFFVPTPDAPPLRELLRAIREAVARVLGIQLGYLVPLVAHQVPKTELGKRGRSELRRRFESGELVAERHAAERLLGGPSTLPACLAVSRLTPRPQVPAGEAPSPGPVLLIAPPALARVWKPVLGVSREVECVEPEASAAAVLEALEARGVRPREVVLALGFEEAAPAHETLSRAVGPLVEWARVLAARTQEPVRFWGVAPLREDAAVSAVAPLLSPGLLWSAGVQAPHLSVRQLWVPPAPSEAAACVAGELEGLRSEREVLWREGQRWERAYAPWAPSGLERARRLRREGLYLVTGALGGLGQAWARYLHHTLGARLVLLGRRAPDSDTAALERELAATYVQADVTDGARVRAVLAEAEARHGRPVDGVFHFAGSFELVPLAELTSETFEGPAAAHVRGSQVLAEALASRPEALLCFASSVMGVLGTPATSYCAATGFVERFAERLAAQGRHAVAVALGPVRATGMSRSLTGAPVGMRMLELPQVLAAWVLAVESGRALVLVGVEGTASPWRAAGLGAGMPLQQPHAFYTQRSPGAAPALKEAQGRVALHPRPSLPRRPDGGVDLEALARETLGALGEVPSGPLEELLVEVFGEALGVDALGVGTSFFSLGGSSLQATRVVLRLQERLGLRLQERALFEHPTVSRLAVHLKDAVRESGVDVTQLSDAQVDLMLRVLGGA